MKHSIHWLYTSDKEEWRTLLPGIGSYIVKKERRFHWSASFADRRTVFTGETAEEVKAQCERAIRAFYMTKKGGPRP